MHKKEQPIYVTANEYRVNLMNLDAQSMCSASTFNDRDFDVYAYVFTDSSFLK